MTITESLATFRREHSQELQRWTLHNLNNEVLIDKLISFLWNSHSEVLLLLFIRSNFWTHCCPSHARQYIYFCFIIKIKSSIVWLSLSLRMRSNHCEPQHSPRPHTESAGRTQFVKTKSTIISRVLCAAWLLPPLLHTASGPAQRCSRAEAD